MTHAVLKRPAAGEFRVQPRLGGTVETPQPPDAVRAVGRRGAGRAAGAPALRAHRRGRDRGRLPDHGGRGQRARPLLPPRAGRRRALRRGPPAAGVEYNMTAMDATTVARWRTLCLVLLGAFLGMSLVVDTVGPAAGRRAAARRDPEGPRHLAARDRPLGGLRRQVDRPRAGHPAAPRLLARRAPALVALVRADADRGRRRADLQVPGRPAAAPRGQLGLPQRARDRGGDLRGDPALHHDAGAGLARGARDPAPRCDRPGRRGRLRPRHPERPLADRRAGRRRCSAPAAPPRAPGGTRGIPGPRSRRGRAR